MKEMGEFRRRLESLLTVKKTPRSEDSNPSLENIDEEGENA